jgi:hypothetical protein
MKKYILTCSVDGVKIDYETEITAEREPDFWTCYETATAHGCDYFYITE